MDKQLSDLVLMKELIVLTINTNIQKCIDEDIFKMFCTGPEPGVSFFTCNVLTLLDYTKIVEVLISHDINTKLIMRENKNKVTKHFSILINNKYFMKINRSYMTQQSDFVTGNDGHINFTSTLSNVLNNVINIIEVSISDTNTDYTRFIDIQSNEYIPIVVKNNTLQFVINDDFNMYDYTQDEINEFIHTIKTSFNQKSKINISEFQICSAYTSYHDNPILVLIDKPIITDNDSHYITGLGGRCIIASTHLPSSTIAFSTRNETLEINIPEPRIPDFKKLIEIKPYKQATKKKNYNKKFYFE